MKYTCHIPTEQYGFISVDIEGTAEEAFAAYEEVKRGLLAGAGIPHREFCSFLDSYLKTGKPPEDGLEVWERMDTRQRDIVNEVKKCLKRITN